MTLPPHARRLVTALADPSSLRGQSLAEWEAIIRVARAARLLSTLGGRLARAGFLNEVPEVVRSHLDSEARLARYRTKMVEVELAMLARALEGVDAPVVLLKGAAYIAQLLPDAADRELSDVDLLVPRARLPEVETALDLAGWATMELDDYDDRYYREWSHELPPRRFPAHVLEVDLHHNIAPPTGRLTTNGEALVAASIPLVGTRFRVLCPEDQLIQACIHLAEDSDFVGRLRELFDIDALANVLEHTPGAEGRLSERGRLHGALRPLWYALHLREELLNLGSPKSRSPGRLLATIPSGMPARKLVAGLAARVLGPAVTMNEATVSRRAAGLVLTIRYFWLRFPPQMLVRHLWTKWRRRRSAEPNA